MSEERYASFDPEEATASGLFDEGDFTIREPRIDFFAYSNSNDKGVGLLCKLEGPDGSILENQFWSAGSEDRVVPSKDNRRIIFVGTANALSPKSNFVKLMKSLKEAGAPADIYKANDVQVLDGVRTRLVRVPNPDAQKNAKGEQPKQVVATKFYGVDKGKGVKGGGGTAKASGSSAPAQTEAAGGGELDDQIVGFIVAAAQKEGGTIARKKVSAPVFQLAQQAKLPQAEKLAASKRAFDTGFLTANSGRPVEAGGEVVAFEYDEKTETIKVAA